MSHQLLIDQTTFGQDRVVFRNDDYPDLYRCPFSDTNWLNLAAILPSSLETLRIRNLDQALFEYQIQGLLTQLSQLMAAKSADQLPNLHQICIIRTRLFTFCHASKHSYPISSIMRPMNLGPWCLDLRKACAGKGIVLHSKPPGCIHWNDKCSCDTFPKSEVETLPELGSARDTWEDSPASPDLHNCR